MGVDITFTFGHRLQNISMAEVSSRCAEMNDLFAEVAQFRSDIGLPLEPWRDAGASNEGEPFYMAPAGFSFRFGASVVRVRHLCRFRIFTQDLAVRTLLRRFVHRNSEIFGGGQVIYAPDEGIGEKVFDMVTEGFTFADIESELLRLSAPAQTFDELDALWRPPWPRPAYYVDSFHDFSPHITNAT